MGLTQFTNIESCTPSVRNVGGDVWSLLEFFELPRSHCCYVTCGCYKILKMHNVYESAGLTPATFGNWSLSLQADQTQSDNSPLSPQSSLLQESYIENYAKELGFLQYLPLKR